MKYVFLSLLIIAFACKKAPNRPIEIVEEDSVVVNTSVDSAKEEKTSSTNGATKELSEKNARSIEGAKVVYQIPASHLPIKLEDEFGDGINEIVIKISNYKKDKISAAILPENAMMNIRFNQIKLPNGTLDGPFGREIQSYSISKNGEVWLVVGKSNMASGDDTGKFKIELK